jgi:hypothetical protein
VRRYAGDEAQQVVVIGGLDAPRRTRFGNRRARPAEPGPAPVEVTRATVIAAGSLDGEARAEAWLKDASGRAAEATVAGALAVLNRALHAHRIAAADPYGAEVAPHQAIVTRVGYGTGDEVAEGRWTAARELPAEQPRIAYESALRPQERFAAVLAARDATLACELLALRARADLDQGRDREAALQLEAALTAAVSELEGWRELHAMPARLDELLALAPGAAEAASAARAGALDEAGRDVVATALARLEAALRARTASASF